MKYKAHIQFSDFYNSLAYKTCIMPISVGQKYHEDAKLKTCIELVNRKFHACHIVVCDSLQRHTLQIKNPSLEPEELYKLSLDLGNSWIDRNKEALTQFSIPYTISRWDDWLTNLDYIDAKHTIDNLYEINSTCKKAIQETAEIFYARSKKRETQLIDKNRFLSSSIKYIQVECAILLLWKKTQSNFLIYPAEIGKAIYLTYQNFIYPHFPEFLMPITIKIKKKELYEL